MLSDVLSQAVTSLRRVQLESGAYTPEQKKHVEKIIAEMEALRTDLDAPANSKFIQTLRETNREAKQEAVKDVLSGKPEPPPPAPPGWKNPFTD